MDLFLRQDWTLFRSLFTLGQHAGIGQNDVPALVAKELADNALDAAGTCRYGRTPDGGLFVEDDGAGLPGTEEEIATFFSVSPLLKFQSCCVCRPVAHLGNGLRMVAGAVLASGGAFVRTRHRHYAYVLAFDCVSRSNRSTRLPILADAAAVFTMRDVFPMPPL